MIELPLLGFSDGWLTIFPSVNEAEIYIEPIDVINEEWVLFDRSSKVLDVSVERLPTRGIRSLFSQCDEIARITEPAKEAYDETRLRELVLAYINKLADEGRGPVAIDPVAAKAMTFDALIAKVIEAGTRSD